jgi:hypothetical protein
MSGFFQNLLTDTAKGFFGSDYLRDYTHASKTFRTNGYQYAPKFKYLFHVYFDINQQAYNQNVASGANFGLAVKTAKLPSYSFDTVQLNQYNRKRIVQTKIKYDPVTITFHDDNGTATGSPAAGGVIRSMWKAYYNYYYADGRNPQVIFGGARGGINPNLGTAGGSGGTAQSTSGATYNSRSQYQPSISGDTNWGYIGDTNIPSDSGGQKIPFFKNITVFGFNQHNFVAYTLINPIITQFAHDTYSYAEGNGTMEHQMTLDYETVVYNEGSLSGNSPSDIVTGFGMQQNYDRTLSPIARPGSNRTILGQGGLVDGASGVLNGLASGNYLGALQAAGTTYNTFKNANLAQIAKGEVTAGIINAVAQTPNRNINVVTPIFGSTPSNTGTAGAPTPNTQQSPTQVGTNPYAGTSNTGPK